MDSRMQGDAVAPDIVASPQGVVVPEIGRFILPMVPPTRTMAARRPGTGAGLAASLAAAGQPGKKDRIPQVMCDGGLFLGPSEQRLSDAFPLCCILAPFT